MSAIKNVIKDNYNMMLLKDYLRDAIKDAGFSHAEISKTPTGTRVALHVTRPGIVIGRKGVGIRALTEKLETDFGLKNPQISVVEIEKPELTPSVMCNRMASHLERGTAFRRATMWTQKQIMEGGAMGVQITISGKLRGDRSAFEKHTAGILPRAGHHAEVIVNEDIVHVKTAMGLIGIRIRIAIKEKLIPEFEMRDKKPRKTKDDQVAETKEQETRQVKDDQVAETKEQETRQVKDDQVAETKEQETRQVKDDQVVERKEQETRQVKDDQVAETKEQETRQVKDDQVAETKEQETRQVKDDQVAETKEQETRQVKDDQVAETKEQETRQVKDDQVAETKEQETRQVKDDQVAETKEQETRQVKDDQVAETKEQETRQVKDDQVVETKEQETRQVKDDQVVETKEQETRQVKEIKTETEQIVIEEEKMKSLETLEEEESELK